MASSPKTTTYLAISNSAFVKIPATIAALRKMIVTEVPTVAQAQSGPGVFTPQGLIYQLWDPSILNADNTRGAFGPSQVALPGEDIVIGDGMTVIGWSAQSVTSSSFNQAGGPVKARAADNPVQIQSATSTNTQVIVKEWNRGILTR